MKSNKRKSQRGLHTQVPAGNGNEEVDIPKDVGIVVVKITPEGVQLDTEVPMDASIDGEELQGTILSQIRLLTIAEVAKRLGVSEASVRKAIRRREITYYPIGVGRGTIRVDEKDADKWIEGR